ncbi:ATP-binding protein [Paucibacter sp. R3-3]|uniref:histidine kinase n=1 Tax=Roseateles agri TaxID=3098619 RepID=A0ABU5DPL8_9BURK|nr:ATP-binding protein [Paucibacter sp. R3-3]MDY0748267.1 ATP-binding protein [Paucibacter sp. R3-3]
MPPFLNTLIRRLARPSVYVYVTVLLMVLGWIVGQSVSERAGMTQLSAMTLERLELYSNTLDAELARHADLPGLLATDPQVQALVQSPQDIKLRAQISRTLARINVRAGAMQIFIAAPDGQVLASSDGAQSTQSPPPPRLREALNAGRPHFFAADERAASLAYYLLHPLQSEGGAAATLVVKVSLAPLEATWVDLGLRSEGERLLVVDAQGVVIMSSVPRWRYFLLGRGSGAARDSERAALRASGRYPADAGFEDMGIPAEALESPGDMPLVRMPPLEAIQKAGPVLMPQERPLVPLGLRLIALSDPSGVRRQARYAGWGGAAFGAFAGVLGLYLASRRRALRQLSQAQAQLQQAHAQLERLVDARTAQLRSTNEELKHQIGQRVKAEDELVQAGKLAVLGQMSAGISHEVNQPLTAMRALARNGLLLLEAGRHATVAENLTAIDAMVERLGLITRQLKTFARKAEQQEGAPVTLLTSIENALLLVGHRLREDVVTLKLDVPPALRVLCDGNRLEQVLVNLFGNAIDAMHGEPQRLLTVGAAASDDGRVRVVVDDTGRGMSENLLPRLFEPFFTTKPAGEGLGLGLVISSKIIHDFGGTLHAQRNNGGGMRFEFDLPALQDSSDV